MVTKKNRGAAAAVAAVAVVQVVVFSITTVVWVMSTVFAGNACSPNCGWDQADVAGMIYFSVAVAMFACTGAAFAYAWRKGRSLSWMPLVASAGIVVGLWIALAVFRDAVVGGG
ncbi:hypothetical protein JVX92_12885 [Microbacterium hominis]|uniref:hypothetical protein n=1 Tax=Microbacterium hominis TaxID=162426 RepID=UPI001962E7E3|nr:hypothetical protein [Microbacterium hominis]QRY40370.1 hypothetical protein JVX92_12885 [Microbacterium hominis]